MVTRVQNTSEASPESQFVFSDMQKVFFKALRFAARWPSAERKTESCRAYPALSNAATRGTRSAVARTGLLSVVPQMRDWSDLGFGSSANRANPCFSASSKVMP